MKSRRTFHPFPALPFELRLRIWEASLESRIIDIRLRTVILADGKSLPSPPEEKRLPAPYKASVPPILHVSREARDAVIWKYHRFGGTTFYPARGALLNPDIDIVYCPDELFKVEDPILPKSVVGPRYYFPERSVLFRMAMDRKFAENITLLAISALGLKAMGTMTENMIPVLKRFKKLRVLYLVGLPGYGGCAIGDMQWTGEPRLLPGRTCPDGECTFWLYMFAGLVPVDIATWQVKPAKDLEFELMDENWGDWTPPTFKFVECRRGQPESLHNKDPWTYCSCKKHPRQFGIPMARRVWSA